MYHDNFKKFVASLFHEHWHPYVLTTIDHVNSKLGAWFRGQVILSLFIGLMSWIALTILGLPYALPLAFLAGILEVVPTLGPTLSAIPAIVVALTVSPTTAITVVAVYVAIQAFEGHILVPNVMQKSVGLNPVVVILAIMIGTNLMGIAGALLAIPFISFIIVIFKSLQEAKG
jgi:predicted PurR-regulated permease PerM